MDWARSRQITAACLPRWTLATTGWLLLSAPAVFHQCNSLLRTVDESSLRAHTHGEKKHLQLSCGVSCLCVTSSHCFFPCRYVAVTQRAKPATLDNLWVIIYSHPDEHHAWWTPFSFVRTLREIKTAVYRVGTWKTCKGSIQCIIITAAFLYKRQMIVCHPVCVSAVC